VLTGLHISGVPIRLVAMRGGSARSGVLLSAPLVLPPPWTDGAGRAGGRCIAWSEWAVTPALEPGRALPLRRYHPSLEPVGGSEVSLSDCSV
jgi:hypothetical protein